MNKTIEAIMSRYSCRRFTDEMPSDTDLQTIAAAAVAAPSAMNRQPWQVIMVKNADLIANMQDEGMKMLANLPDKSAYERIMSRGGKLFYNTQCMAIVAVRKVGTELIDCGIMVQNIAISAASLGINSLICGLAAFAFAGERGEEFKKRLGFADGFEIGMAVLLGKSADQTMPHEPDLSKVSFVE